MGLRQVGDHEGARLRHIQEDLLSRASSFQTTPGRAYPTGAQERLRNEEPNLQNP